MALSKAERATGAPKRKLRAMLADEFDGWDPFRDMARDAMDESLPLEHRQRCREQIGDRLVPKLRSVEVTGNDGGAIQVAMLGADAAL